MSKIAIGYSTKLQASLVLPAVITAENTKVIQMKNWGGRYMK
jgi:hypothetical protein